MQINNSFCRLSWSGRFHIIIDWRTIRRRHCCILRHKQREREGERERVLRNAVLQITTQEINEAERHHFGYILFTWVVSVLPAEGWRYTRWFKYDRDDLCVNKSQFVPVIFEPPCTWCSSNEDYIRPTHSTYKFILIQVTFRTFFSVVQQLTTIASVEFQNKWS